MDPNQQPINTDSPARRPELRQPQMFGPAGVSPQVSPTGGPPPSPYLTPQPKNYKPFIIIGGVAGVLLLVAIGLVLFLPGNGKKKTPTQQTSNQSNTSQGPQAASAVDVEQANSSISQDVSGLNDDQDFPVDQLTDHAFGL